MSYNLDDVCDIYAPTRPTGHWISVPRKWKRSQRIKKDKFGNEHNNERLSKGWRKHVRKHKGEK